MGIQFGDPSSPAYVATRIFHMGMMAGFLVVVAACVLVDKVGNAMYRKGYARPFFLRGHRIHHFWIYAIIPASYVIMAGLILTGQIQLVQDMVWYRLALLAPIAAVCVVIDFLGDGFGAMSGKAIKGHEWTYALIPLYLVSFVVNVYV